MKNLSDNTDLPCDTNLTADKGDWDGRSACSSIPHGPIPLFATPTVTLNFQTSENAREICSSHNKKR
jgi:hypothetical protein